MRPLVAQYHLHDITAQQPLTSCLEAEQAMEPFRPSTSTMLALKNVFRQKSGDRDIGKVDHIANAQIDRHTTDDIGLFAAPTALLQQLDHVDQGVAGCQG